MTEAPRKNSYEDSDFRQIIAEIEGYEDDKASARAEAAGKCSQIARRIKTTKSRAKALGIPKAILDAMLKTRKLERKLQEAAAEVPDDLTEMFEDAVGQFSFLAPEPDEAPEPVPAKRAASRRKKAAEKLQADEQAEGARILEEMTTH
jgi:hypothetical protein